MEIREPGSVDWSTLLPERTGVDVDGLPWEEFVDASGNRLGVRFKWIVDPALGKNCMLLHLPPNHRAAPHWHTSDTVYVVTEGEFVVEGEGSFFPGQVRWVRGGFAYGAEGAGPAGCEFYFFSLGPYGQHDPDVEPPPLGRWDDAGRPSA
ncbi:MAG TPA: cupin domain-containing protein [Acidimicrobiia bacterium]|nr:cupin domain-containing protein [Acidimicrobiia bacterium]